MGVGSSKGPRGVHWGVARQILLAWVVTIPATAIAGALAWGALATVGIR